MICSINGTNNQKYLSEIVLFTGVLVFNRILHTIEKKRKIR